MTLTQLQLPYRKMKFIAYFFFNTFFLREAYFIQS